MKIVFLTTFKPGVDRELIDDFLAGVAEVFRQGPFTSVEHGAGLRLSKGSATQADWGFIMDVDSESLEAWRNHQGHRRLGELLKPVSDFGISFEL